MAKIRPISCCFYKRFFTIESVDFVIQVCRLNSERKRCLECAKAIVKKSINVIMALSDIPDGQLEVYRFHLFLLLRFAVFPVSLEKEKGDIS